MVKQTRGQKAAKTLGSEHMAAIGREGGKKSVGTFATKRGFAKKAGQRSGMARKLKAYDKQIAALDERIAEAYRFDSKNVPDDIKELEKTRTRLVLDRELLEADYNGKVAIDMGESVQEFMGQDNEK